MTFLTKLSLVAILYYDYILTFSSEVHLFWSRPCRNLPSFFFFLSRYSALLLHIPITLEFFYPAFSYRVSCQRAHYHPPPTSVFFLAVSTSLLMMFSIANQYSIRCRALLYFHRLYCFYAMAIVIGKSDLVWNESLDVWWLLVGPSITNHPHVCLLRSEQKTTQRSHFPRGPTIWHDMCKYSERLSRLVFVNVASQLIVGLRNE